MTSTFCLGNRWLHPGPGRKRDSSRYSTYSTLGMPRMATNPQPDSQSDTDNNGSQMKMSEKQRTTHWHPVVTFKKRGGKRKETKIKHWPFTFSKIWTFAVSPIGKKNNKKTKKCTSHCSDRSWLKGKWTRQKKKGKSKWWWVLLKMLSFTWDPSEQRRADWLHTAEAPPTTQAFQTWPNSLSQQLSVGLNKTNNSSFLLATAGLSLDLQPFDQNVLWIFSSLFIGKCQRETMVMLIKLWLFSCSGLHYTL